MQEVTKQSSLLQSRDWSEWEMETLQYFEKKVILLFSSFIAKFSLDELISRWVDITGRREHPPCAPTWSTARISTNYSWRFSISARMFEFRSDREYDAQRSRNITRRAIRSPTSEELPREIVRSTPDRASRICQVHIVSRLAVKLRSLTKWGSNNNTLWSRCFEDR